MAGEGGEQGREREGKEGEEEEKKGEEEEEQKEGVDEEERVEKEEAAVAASLSGSVQVRAGVSRYYSKPPDWALSLAVT